MSNNVLVTGGAGFIGCNVAARYIAQKYRVTILDNLSRPGAEANLEWLRSEYGASAFEFVHADVRDPLIVNKSLKDQQIVFHLAGQVAVTTSVGNPREDFETNALGTFNVLEAARSNRQNPIVIFASTNKVYGEMESSTAVEMVNNRYEYRDYKQGIPETFPLDFHSPYGCSKGAADQYVRDYARIYGLRTVVFRQSCIYGPRQMGVEDQGWVAWFSIAALNGKPITIYGDGKQVRDVLYIDDLVDAYQAAVSNINRTSGQIYNIGGGPGNTLAIWTELGPILERLLSRSVHVDYANWRPGDQRIYVSDIKKAAKDLSWSPKVGVIEGVELLFNWVKQNKFLFS